jgi:hypothetical protein
LWSSPSSLVLLSVRKQDYSIVLVLLLLVLVLQMMTTATRRHFRAPYGLYRVLKCLNYEALNSLKGLGGLRRPSGTP